MDNLKNQTDVIIDVSKDFAKKADKAKKKVTKDSKKLVRKIKRKNKELFTTKADLKKENTVLKYSLMGVSAFATVMTGLFVAEALKNKK